MKTKLLLAAGLAAVSMAGVTIHKANAVTDSGLITAEIIAAIDLDCVGETLNFGSAITSAVAGTVVVATDGTVSQTGGVTLVPASGAAQAVCQLGGDTGTTADITFVNASENVTSGPNTMAVNTFRMDYNSSGPLASLIGVNLTGAQSDLEIGGTLNVGINQAPGTYTGTFTIDVVYN